MVGIAPIFPRPLDRRPSNPACSIGAASKGEREIEKTGEIPKTRTLDADGNKTIIAILATLALAWALAAVKGSWTANQRQLFLALDGVSLEMSKISRHWPSTPGNG